MGNPLFAYPDRTLTADLLSGIWSTGLPLTNLKDRRLSAVARSSSATVTSTVIMVNFETTRLIRVAAILRHNLSPAATVRVRLYSATYQLGTLLYDSTDLPAYPAYYPTGILNSQASNYATRALTTEDAAIFKPDYWLAMPDTYAAQCAVIDFTDTANPDGYVELGRCILADAWQPSQGMLTGAKFGLTTGSTKERSLGGVDYYLTQPSRRVVTLNFSLPLAEAMAQGYELQRRQDLSGELFFVWTPDDVEGVYRQRSFLAHLSALSPLDTPYYNTNTFNYDLEEIL